MYEHAVSHLSLPRVSTEDQKQVGGKSRPFRLCVVLLPLVSISTVAHLLDPLKLANALSTQPLFNVKLMSWDGRPLAISPDIQIGVDGAFDDLVQCDGLIVAADACAPFADHKLFMARLARVAKWTSWVAGVGDGVWWLAEAGLLYGYRASVRLPALHSFVERFTATVATRRIYEFDRDRATCAGGASTFDFILEMICRHQGAELAARIGEQWCAGTLRTREESQVVPADMYGAAHEALGEVLRLMDANLSEPLSMEEIANAAGLSKRQIERLFRQYLRSAPSRYYLNLRLEQARKRLRSCASPVRKISEEFGFPSAAQFCTAYRKAFGQTPTSERRAFASAMSAGHTDHASVGFQAAVTVPGELRV